MSLRASVVKCCIQMVEQISRNFINVPIRVFIRQSIVRWKHLKRLVVGHISERMRKEEGCVRSTDSVKKCHPFMNMNPNILSVGAFPTRDAMYQTSGAVLNEKRRSIVSPECNVIKLGALLCRPDAMEIKQGFSHISEQVRVKKLAHGSRIRIATWNIGTFNKKINGISRYYG